MSVITSPQASHPSPQVEAALREAELAIAAHREATLPPELRRLLRKLQAWELPHLQQHAAELAARQQAEYWHEQAVAMMSAATADGRTVGLTHAGQLDVLASLGDATHQPGALQ